MVNPLTVRNIKEGTFINAKNGLTTKHFGLHRPKKISRKTKNLK
jgi:hypothetical protein